MDRIFFLLFLSTMSVIGQQKDDVSFKNFHLAKGELIWQKVFESTLPKDNLMTSFKLNIISTINTENFQELDNRFTFNVVDDEIDFKSYGGSWGNTAIFVQYPIKYLVMVDFKESRYRVTVKNIFSDMRAAWGTYSSVDDSMTKKRKTMFSTSKIVVKGIEYYNLHFLSRFDISRINEENDKW